MCGSVQVVGPGRPSGGTSATACNCVRRSGTGLLARMLALRDRGARAVGGVVVGTRSGLGPMLPARFRSGWRSLERGRRCQPIFGRQCPRRVRLRRDPRRREGHRLSNVMPCRLASSERVQSMASWRSFVLAVQPASRKGRLRALRVPTGAAGGAEPRETCTGHHDDPYSPVAQRHCSPRRARWAHPRVPRRGVSRRDAGRVAHFLSTLVAVSWCRSSQSDRRPTAQRSPLHPAPGSKTDGPGLPSQTPVHRVPSGAIEFLVPYTS